MPYEMIRYQYRKHMNLTAQEFLDEPVDQFFTNLTIWGQIKEKQRLDQEHGSRRH